MPTVFATGNPSKTELGMTTFKIDAHQWVYFTKEKGKPIFPFTGSYPMDGANPRTNQPFPTANNPKFVQAVGYLTGILLDDDQSLKRFTIELHGITFLGPAPPIFLKVCKIWFFLLATDFASHSHNRLSWTL